MVKHIKPHEIFKSTTNCLLKSISGGSIKNVTEYLEENQISLRDSKHFIVTCGSNDLDTTFKSTQKVIELYLELARLLKKLFPSAELFFNKLVPRKSTKYVQLQVY